MEAAATVVVKKRGRQPGTTKSIVTIKDPLLGKFHIEIDDNQFAVIEEGKQQPVAHCSSLGRALFRVAHAKITSSTKTMSIKEYIAEFKKIQTELETLM